MSIPLCFIGIETAHEGEVKHDQGRLQTFYQEGSSASM